MRNLGFSLAMTVALSFAIGGAPAFGQTSLAAPTARPPASKPQAAQLPPLTDFVGTYTYQGATIEIIAPDGLVAVLDGGKYPLRRKTADVFVNGGGADVTFHRGPDGVVTAVEDNTGLNRRLSAQVSARAKAAFQPQPPGSPPYRYRAPRNLRDGIPVGDVAKSDLGAEAAGGIVAGILDKTWGDVDSVLIFQGGKLVLEEYFYGYDRDTPHQLRSATKSVVGAVVGAAVANGAVTLDKPVLPRLGYPTVANPDPRKSAITLRHLLTLQSGLDCDDHVAGSPGGENQLYDTPDWIRVMVDLKMVEYPRHGGPLLHRRCLPRRSHGGKGDGPRSARLCAGAPLQSLGHPPGRLDLEPRPDQRRQAIRHDGHASARHAEVRHALRE
jgi:hypothetical protein